MPVHCQASGRRSPPFTEFHRQGALYPEDALPGWNDPGGFRTGGFHRTVGGTRTKTQGQSHSLPRRTGTKPQMAQRFDATPIPLTAGLENIIRGLEVHRDGGHPRGSQQVICLAAEEQVFQG